SLHCVPVSCAVLLPGRISLPTRRSSDLVLEQAHDREGDPVRNESGAARRHIAAIDDRRDDRGERRRATDAELLERLDEAGLGVANRKSTRLNSSHVKSSYAVFCLKKKKT